MIQRQPGPAGTVTLTFQLPADLMEGTVSVVGDFNDWQPGVTTFGGCGSLRSATVEVKRGFHYGFRYVTEAGEWIDYEWGDGHIRDDEGVMTGVVDLTFNAVR